MESIWNARFPGTKNHWEYRGTDERWRYNLTKAKRKEIKAAWTGAEADTADGKPLVSIYPWTKLREAHVECTGQSLKIRSDLKNTALEPGQDSFNTGDLKEIATAQIHPRDECNTANCLFLFLNVAFWRFHVMLISCQIRPVRQTADEPPEEVHLHSFEVICTLEVTSLCSSL